jgi:hypothetical protein
MINLWMESGTLSDEPILLIVVHIELTYNL